MEDSNNAAQNEQPESKTHPFCQALIAPLRGEIVESEKARMDFLKYKLLAVAALGSIGLGLGSKTGGSTFEHIYILGIIPLVCLYVDLLCHHNTLRILVIGQYFANKGCPYENFISQAGETLPKIELFGKNAGAGYFFELEDWALEGSTWLLSGFILIFGIVIFFFRLTNGYDYLMLTLIIPGLLGISLAVVSWKRFKRKKEVLFEVAKELKAGN